MNTHPPLPASPALNTHPWPWQLSFSLLALFTFLLTGNLSAEDKTTYTYEGKISGVFCSACSAKVKAALGKLPGVTGVKITATDELGVQALQVLSTSPDLTKEGAITSLGESAREFTIHQFGKKP